MSYHELTRFDTYDLVEVLRRLGTETSQNTVSTIAQSRSSYEGYGGPVEIIKISLRRHCSTPRDAL